MQPGTCLGERYTLEEHLASSADAQLWRGHDAERDREVRIKVLDPELSRDPALRARFRESATETAALGIAGVIDVIDCVEHRDGEDVAVCQIAAPVKGRPLSETLRERTLSADETLFNIADAAWSLQEAHDAGVRHLNLKPSNIIVDDEGSTTIVDFGFLPPAALAATGESPPRLYAAPEQLRGEDAGVTADVYGLGALAFRCITGNPPYAADTAAALTTAHRDGPPPTLPPAACIFRP